MNRRSDFVKIKQAVIPAAGLGTRFFPVTKCVPKELIPLVDKPCIHHVVEEALAAGVEEVIFIVSDEKRGIEEYFRSNDSLYQWLVASGKAEQANAMREFEQRANYRFVVQKEPLGLGHAVWCARDVICEDHFIVILPDDVITAEVPVCRQMALVFERSPKPLVSVMQVGWDDVHLYGIVRAMALSDRVGDVQDIIEKPRRENAPSNLAVIGRYILPRTLFSILEATKPGAGGEIQLTDALRQLISDGGLHSYSFEGERHDTGNPLGWLQANIALALQKEELKVPVLETIKSLSALYL